MPYEGSKDDCPRCKGSGEMPNGDECEDCGGSGKSVFPGEEDD